MSQDGESRSSGCYILLTRIAVALLVAVFLGLARYDFGFIVCLESEFAKLTCVQQVSW